MFLIKVLISLKYHLDITQNEIQQPLRLFDLTISSLHSIIYIYTHLNLEGHTYIYLDTECFYIQRQHKFLDINNICSRTNLMVITN